MHLVGDGRKARSRLASPDLGDSDVKRPAQDVCATACNATDRGGINGHGGCCHLACRDGQVMLNHLESGKLASELRSFADVSQAMFKGAVYCACRLLGSRQCTENNGRIVRVQAPEWSHGSRIDATEFHIVAWLAGHVAALPNRRSA